MKTTQQLKLKLSLTGVRPPVWRNVIVPSNYTLGDLHDVIQKVFDWNNHHLHCFEIGSRRNFDQVFYTNNKMSDDPYSEMEEESDITLAEVFSDYKKIKYTYDFGDNWELDIVFQRISDTPAPISPSISVKSKGPNPPEDCGGVGAFMEYLYYLDNREELQQCCKEFINQVKYFFPEHFTEEELAEAEND